MSELANNQFIQAGTYEAKFSGENLSSGIYICKLSSKSKYRTIKMLFLK